MTKKHFEAFAAAIRRADATPEARAFAALVIARIARADNPRFDPVRFFDACGLVDGETK